MRLLIVEDNVRLSRLMAQGLKERGFACDRAAGLGDADAAMAVANYDAVVLDLGLADGDGLEWLRDMPSPQHRPPVLILTARSALGDRVKGLDAGADDYLVKPFALDELTARLRALLRRPGTRGPATLRVGALRFDVPARTAHHRDRLVPLTRREADLLEYLMRHAGAVVSRDAIRDALYSFDDDVTPNAVEALFSRLRRKLDDHGARDMLMTVRGIGYLMRRLQS